MTCITKGGDRCNKCCQVLHINGPQWNKFERGIISVTDGDQLKQLFVRVSKRRAKKINPYIFNRPIEHKDQREFLNKAAYFTCNALIQGVCSVYNDRPDICRVYDHKSAFNDYSPTCDVDINIIARSA